MYLCLSYSDVYGIYSSGGIGSRVTINMALWVVVLSLELTLQLG